MGQGVWTRLVGIGSVVAAVAVGCGDEASQSNATSNGSGGATTTTAVGGAGGTASSVGVGGDGGAVASVSSSTGGPKGCKAVDFLFVIDSSVSMKMEQTSLLASFPGFIDAIESNLAAMGNFHIMVVDTDAKGKCKTGESACNSQDLCKEQNGYACTATLDACDTTLGAGVIQPIGNESSNQICTLTGGKRYIQPSEPDVKSAFSCTAKVGITGAAAELPMNAMEAALSQDLLKADACNDGFLRDDAVLVITIITDEGGNDTGTPEDWKKAVLAAKKSQPGESDAETEKKVVVIAFSRAIGAIPKFVDLWVEGQKFQGKHSDADYGPLFSQAIKGIEKACEVIK